MDIFPYCPSKGLPGNVSHRTFGTQYGDGYEQVAGDGINTLTQSWDLQFAGKAAKISAIKAFLDNLQGFKAFQWTPPLGAPAAFRANAYTITVISKDLYSLSVNFKQAYKL